MAMTSQTSEQELELSRFVVGIDLGTTNCALAYVDTHATDHRIQTFDVPQLVAVGQCESRSTLPSFLYDPAAGELSQADRALPWKTQNDAELVGVFARDHGSQVPGRLIASAKSWLCHTGVDRTARLLPWQGAPDVRPRSPVETAAAYLNHLRQAWDHAHPEHRLADQDIVLTLPASFDEIARELTVEAARKAKLKRVVLIEEPQAAFYSWIHRHEQGWMEKVLPGQVVLVCDVGGGTSDFTLIHARPDPEHEKQVTFHRIAVGDHLILGGDNLDLALAQSLEAGQPVGQTLSPKAWDVLLKQCRWVKETLLGEDPPESVRVNLPGSGSRLIGGGTQLEARADQVRPLLLDGFFPRVGLEEKPQEKASGFQEFGLPFASDPRVTAYLARFLSQASEGLSETSLRLEGGLIRPDWLLFNGGVFSSPAIRDRLRDVVSEWFSGADPSWNLGLLDHDRLDLAVSHGAAYYGLVRRGIGIKINAGLARSYYIGFGGETPRAICLVPAGTEPGCDIELTDHQFQLLVSTPVEFPIYVSSTRLNDAAGTMVDVDSEQLRPLLPIRTVLKTQTRGERSEVSVILQARLTEIGTLELGCRETEGDRQWKMQFDVRTATQTDVEEHRGSAETAGFVDEQTWENCLPALAKVFGEDATGDPESLVRDLVDAAGEPKESWTPSLLRRIWEELLRLENGRRRSAKHEARWLNLLGYSLRPGYGLALDDWRVAETWKLLQGKLVHGSAACRAESWILWRRLSGGLTPGQQQTLAGPMLQQIKQLHRQLTTGRGAGANFDFGSHEAAEIWRLLGSLEQLSVVQKSDLGQQLIDLLAKPKLQGTRHGMMWAIGRLGTRVPVYGLLNHVIARDVVERWIDRLLEQKENLPGQALTLMQLARRCEDRYRDISDESRARVLDWMRSHKAPNHLIKLVERGGKLETEEQDQLLGDSLPVGLRLR
jgi:hypothetical protein